ncbi:MAG: FAD-dependent oxidoreductase [Haloferacaceae archaeon]
MRAPAGAAPPERRQVCLVGCGVGGLIAAAVLRHHGHAPTLVVAPAPPADDRRALVLWSGALALLEDLGIDAVGGVTAAGTAARTWRSWDADGSRRVEHAPPGDPPLLAVDRARVREALRGDLPSACLRLSKTPVAVDPSPDGPVVTFDDGVRERFDAVIGADGRRSWVRRSVLGGAPRRSAGPTTWSFRSVAPLPPSTLLGAWGERRGLLLGPGARGRAVAGPGTDPASPTEAVRRIASSIPAPAVPDPDRLVDAARLDGHTGWARQWARTGVALLGDAAHAFAPALALGASLAVADAAALAAALWIAAHPPFGVPTAAAIAAVAAAAVRRAERRPSAGDPGRVG